MASHDLPMGRITHSPLIRPPLSYIHPSVKEPMKTKKHIPILLAALMAGSAHAAVVQIGTLALVNNIGGTTVRFDPDTGTRTTQNAGGPVNIPSSFIGYSQNMGGGTPDANDLGLRTFSTSTTIHNLSKSTSGTLAGGVQWSFDLTPLDAYLATNTLTATTLELRLRPSQNNTSGTYNAYISYTNAAESITLTNLPTTATAIRTDFFAPGNAANVGDVVNGDFKVIAKGIGGNNYATTTAVDLLGLYNSGVKQFNLSMVAAVFSSDSQQITIGSGGNGIFLEAVPEPSSTLLASLGMLALLRRRR
jgi:hypothetical protein